MLRSASVVGENRQEGIALGKKDRPAAAPVPLQPGDPAPEFRLPADDGREIALSDLRGKRVVLFFYPKDATPG